MCVRVVRSGTDCALAVPAMSDKAPTETMKTSDVRAGPNKLVDRACRNETRGIGEKSGAPVAAVVSANDRECLRQLETEDHDPWSIRG